MTQESIEAKLVAALSLVVREAVRKELETLHRSDPDEWIPHTRWPVKSRRVACELARSGRLAARRKGKLWLARRRDLDAWVASMDAESECAPMNAIDELATAMAHASRGRAARNEHEAR